MTSITADGISITQHRPHDGEAHLFLIDPGAAGKTTLGQCLANRLSRDFVDIDDRFLACIGDITDYIRHHGYTAYKIANGQLAEQLVREATAPAIFATSSGFLTPDNPLDVLAQNGALLARGYAICLLPSLDMEEAVSITVARQLTRPFARNAAREEAVIRERFPIYAALGDLRVASFAPPEQIAVAIMARLAPLDPPSLHR